ncbi:Cytoplasmic glyoxalase II [Glugoides intestinalis]
MKTGFISIRVRSDNLMYLFYSNESAFCVDAFSPEVLMHALSCDFSKQNYLTEEIVELEKVKARKLLYALTTHSHFDHAGGNARLKELSPETCFIDDKNMQEVIMDGFSIKPIATPCHTLDSVCFIVKDEANDRRYAITGDFLFKLGCGRFFEGTAEMFQESLAKLLEAVNDDCVLLYGHDYYEVNRRFAEQFYVIKGCEDFFLTIGEEKLFNPFINPEKARKTVINPFNATKTEIISYLRKLKDSF